MSRGKLQRAKRLYLFTQGYNNAKEKLRKRGRPVAKADREVFEAGYAAAQEGDDFGKAYGELIDQHDNSDAIVEMSQAAEDRDSQTADWDTTDSADDDDDSLDGADFDIADNDDADIDDADDDMADDDEADYDDADV